MTQPTDAHIRLERQVATLTARLDLLETWVGKRQASERAGNELLEKCEKLAESNRQVHELKTVNEALKVRIERLLEDNKTRRENHTRTIKELEAEIAQLKAAIKHCRIDEWEGKNEQLKAEIAQRIEEVKRRDDAIRELDVLLKDARESKSFLSEMSAKAANRANEADCRVAELEKTIAVKDAAIRGQASTIEGMQKTIKDVKMGYKMLDDTNKVLDEVNEEMKRNEKVVGAEMRMMLARVEELKKTIAVKDAEIRSQLYTIEEVKRVNEEIKKGHKVLDDDNKMLDEVNKKLKKENDWVKKTIEDKDTEIAGMKGAIRRMNENNAELRKRKNEAIEELGICRGQLERWEPPRESRENEKLKKEKKELWEANMKLTEAIKGRDKEMMMRSTITEAIKVGWKALDKSNVQLHEVNEKLKKENEEMKKTSYKEAYMESEEANMKLRKENEDNEVALQRLREMLLRSSDVVIEIRQADAQKE